MGEPREVLRVEEENGKAFVVYYSRSGRRYVIGEEFGSRAVAESVAEVGNLLHRTIEETERLERSERVKQVWRKARSDGKDSGVS